MDGNTVVRKLLKDGWELDRINGSHHILRKGNKTVSIPVHGKKDLAKGTLKAIEKQTGVTL